MSLFIYLSCSGRRVVDIYVNFDDSPRRLLGQLFVSFSTCDRYVWDIPSYQSSPDIGEEPGDPPPPGVSNEKPIDEIVPDDSTEVIHHGGMIMGPHIYMSCSNPGLLDMSMYIGNRRVGLGGQLYLHPAYFDPSVWYFPLATDSPDIGDEPGDQQPQKWSKFMYTAIRFQYQSEELVDIRVRYADGSLGSLLGELYMPSHLSQFDTCFCSTFYPVATDSPDIGGEPSDQQPPGVSESAARKGMPIARGVLDYFPSALLVLAEVSRIGNEQHNPGQPMHWAYGKSADHADALLRHLVDRRKKDTDRVPHVAKVAWRALAMLQTYLEENDPELHLEMEEQRALMAQGK